MEIHQSQTTNNHILDNDQDNSSKLCIVSHHVETWINYKDESVISLHCHVPCTHFPYVFALCICIIHLSLRLLLPICSKI